MLKKERLRARKNFLPTIFLIVLLIISGGVIFFFVPPENLGVPVLFVLITFLFILFSSSLLFANARRGFLTSLGVIILMVLNFVGLGNFLNLFLVLGILLSIEYYLSSRTN